MTTLGTDDILFRRDTGPRLAVRVAVFVAALLLAGVTLLMTSMAELLSPHPPTGIAHRPVDTVAWKAPVPPPLPPPPEPEPEPEPQIPEPPVLELAPPLPPQPLRLPVRLDFALQVGVGDFDLEFQVDPNVEEFPATTVQAAAPLASPPVTPPKSVYELSDLDHAPKILLQRRPAYPYRARARGVEGHVDVEFVVGTDGRVGSVTAVGAEPPGVFDAAAQRAVARWRFEPGVRAGAPVPVRMQIRIRFSLGR